MKFGFYEFDITPPIGSIIPGGFGARYSTEILDKLYARAFVTDNGEKTLALVVIDACGITADIADAIRERVAKFTPIAPECVMVMATHAHGAGPTLNWGEEVVTDAEYIKMLVNRAADAIYAAWQRMAESELYSGSDDLYGISFIRVYHMKDGSLKTNPGGMRDMIDRPTTTIDPEVGVLAVKQGEKFVGAIINFATHPATIAGTETTGDYISILSKKMKEYYGEDFVTVFINGACGNINHVDPYEEPRRDKYTIYRNVGEKIAETAKNIISAAERVDSNVLGYADTSVRVKFRKPNKEELVEAQKIFLEYGDDLINRVPGTPEYKEVFFALQRLQIMADKHTERDLYLQAFRIGNAYVAGTPTQIFVQFGKKMKAACPGLCFVSAFANDYCGYVPTPDCMKPGVYEARLARTSALEPAAGDKLTEAMIELLGKLSK